MVDNIKFFFNPENIAVVGASNNPRKAGYVIINNLINMGYPKKIFPVNSKEGNILGLKCYPTVYDITDKVEMVVLITPSKEIKRIIEDIENRMKKWNDIKVIVCAAAGFGELKTEEGRERERILVESSRKYGIRVMGPNCIGVIDNYNRVDTTFVETLMPPENKGKGGGISFISQSGALAASILMWGASQPVPLQFNKFISIGNMADVDFIDLLEYLENDDNTRVIGLYIEGYPKAGELIDLMRRIALKKPIVVLKVGRTSRGAAAANSHTGSLAGEDRVYDSVFRQYGIIRVNSIDELMDTLQAFDRVPIPEGNRLFLLSQAGGPGIFCMDTLSQFEFIDFSIIGEKSRERLRELLPPMASFCQPEGYADISASAAVEHHTGALEILMDDSEVDGVLLITVVPTFLPKKELAEGLVSTYKRIKKHKNKPLFPVIMAGNWVKDIREIIEENGIPTFETPDRAAWAAANMIKYSLFLKKHNAERQV